MCTHGNKLALPDLLSSCCRGGGRGEVEGTNSTSSVLDLELISSGARAGGWSYGARRSFLFLAALVVDGRPSDGPLFHFRVEWRPPDVVADSSFSSRPVCLKGGSSALARRPRLLPLASRRRWCCSELTGPSGFVPESVGSVFGPVLGHVNRTGLQFSLVL